MKVTFKFRSEVTISGDNFEEIQSKWDSMQLYEPNSGVEFIETESVEDAETFEDITDMFNC